MIILFRAMIAFILIFRKFAYPRLMSILGSIIYSVLTKFSNMTNPSSILDWFSMTEESQTAFKYSSSLDDIDKGKERGPSQWRTNLEPYTQMSSEHAWIMESM